MNPDPDDALRASARALLEAVYELYGNPEECDDCYELNDSGNNDSCALHSSETLWKAIVGMETVLGPCICGHAVYEHEEDDARHCRILSCHCRTFRLPDGESDAIKRSSND